MRTLRWAVVVAGFLGVAAIEGAGQAQAVLRDPAFEVTLPAGVPLPTATKTGDATGVDYSAETATGVYRIQYIDLPSAPAPAGLFESIRKNVRTGMAIDREETFTHPQGHPGLRLFISMPNLNQVMRMDCVVAGKRLYRAWYIARTKPALETSEVRAFFDSFKIKN